MNATRVENQTDDEKLESEKLLYKVFFSPGNESEILSIFLFLKETATPYWHVILEGMCLWSSLSLCVVRRIWTEMPLQSLNLFLQSNQTIGPEYRPSENDDYDVLSL